MLGSLFVLFLAQTVAAELDEKTREVQAAIGEVETGLRRYRIVYDFYPEDGNRNLVSALSPDYAAFQLEALRDGILIDPWGRPYVYERYDPGDNLPWHTYVFYSIGPNGADESGRGDDIGNW